MILKSLRDYFLTKTEITAILVDRIAVGALPQGSPIPAADMRITGSTHDHLLSGLSGACESNVTIDCYADGDPEDADNLANKMMYSGIVGSRLSSGTIAISSIQLIDGPTQSEESVSPGSESWRYVTSFGLKVMWCRVL